MTATACSDRCCMMSLPGDSFVIWLHYFEVGSGLCITSFDGSNRSVSPIEIISLRITCIRCPSLDNGQLLGISLAEAEMPNILYEHYRGIMPVGRGKGHEVPRAWLRRVQRRRRAMIRSCLVEVGKQSAGLLVANARLDKSHVSWTQHKHRCRPVGCSYEHRPLPSQQVPVAAAELYIEGCNAEDISRYPSWCRDGEGRALFYETDFR